MRTTLRDRIERGVAYGLVDAVRRPAPRRGGWLLVDDPLAWAVNNEISAPGFLADRSVVDGVWEGR